MSSGHFPIERSRWSPLRDTIRAVRWGNALFYVPTHCVNREKQSDFLRRGADGSHPTANSRGEREHKSARGEKEGVIFGQIRVKGKKNGIPLYPNLVNLKSNTMKNTMRS